tara:strand:- start:16279 stop:17148 length:870 start_codon:yes stop_codon:yes gene_type:complete
MTDQAIDAGAAADASAAPAEQTTTTETNTAATDDQGGGISLKLPEDGGEGEGAGNDAAPADKAGKGAADGAGEGEGTDEAPTIPEGYFKLPGEDASDEDVAAYRAAMGVPENPDGYGDVADIVKGIEGVPEHYAPAPWLAELAHAKNIPVETYQELVRKDAEGVASYMAEVTKAAEAERKETAKSLKAKYGDKTAEKMTLGQRALNHFGKDVEGFGDFMAKHGLDQHPKFIEFAMVLGEQFGESAFVDGAGGGGGKNPWSKDSFNLTEQGRLMRENPARAKQLKAAAGT